MKTATQVLEDQMSEDMAKLLQEEIDWEIIAGIMVSAGWAKVELATVGPNRRAIDIDEWLRTECSEHWKRRGRTFLFKDKNEAALFRLTWE